MRASAALGMWTVMALPAMAQAQDVRLSVPLEYTSGFTLGAAPTPFAAGVRTALLARLGRSANLLVGPAAAGLYDGSDWAAAGGLRLGTRLPRMGLGDAGLFVFVEGLKGRARTPVSVTVLADLPVRPALFARFGLSLTRDLRRDKSEVALLLGFDLARAVVEITSGDRPHVVEP